MQEQAENLNNTHIQRVGTQMAPKALELDVFDDVPPSIHQLEQFCVEGIVEARISGALELPESSLNSRRFLAWIECLRDMTACALPVRWHGASNLNQLSSQLRHISPPICNELDGFASWHETHRFGIFFWRSGPKFAMIVDRRSQENANEYILDTPDYLDVFGAAQSVVSRESLIEISHESLVDMEQEGIILSIEGWSLALPIRMRHWPVPFTAI